MSNNIENRTLTNKEIAEWNASKQAMRDAASIFAFLRDITADVHCDIDLLISSEGREGMRLICDQAYDQLWEALCSTPALDKLADRSEANEA